MAQIQRDASVGWRERHNTPLCVYQNINHFGPRWHPKGLTEMPPRLLSSMRIHLCQLHVCELGNLIANAAAAGETVAAKWAQSLRELHSHLLYYTSRS
jgi:hypothetical protein